MRAVLKRRIHVSWLIAWFSAAFMAGIALSVAIGRPASNPAWLVASLPLLLLAITKRTRAAVALVVIAGILCGLWRGGIERAPLMQYASLLGKYVVVQGMVSQDPSTGPRGDQRITLTQVAVNGQHLPGALWVSIVSAADIKRNDTLAVKGKLTRGFGNMPASLPSARIMGVHRSSRYDIGLQVRDWFAAGVRRAIPEPQASLGNGFLVGQSRNIPQELSDEMKIVGLTHIVVASGYNLTILVGLARRLFLRTSKYLSLLSSTGMIIGFMAITGLSPSMTRAGLVTGLSLAAWYYGRKIHPLVLLPFAAAITALINPEYLWGDAGWYLSFASFAGVIILAPLIQRSFWGRARPGAMRQVVVETLSAQLATMPYILFTFGHYSLYALLANILVLPLIPLAMLLTFGAGLAGTLVPVAAHIAGLPAAVTLHYITSVVAWISSWPAAQGSIKISVPYLTLGYAALIIGAVLLWRKTRHDFRKIDKTIAEEIEA